MYLSWLGIRLIWPLQQAVGWNFQVTMETLERVLPSQSHYEITSWGVSKYLESLKHLKCHSDAYRKEVRAPYDHVNELVQIGIKLLMSLQTDLAHDLVSGKVLHTPDRTLLVVPVRPPHTFPWGHHWWTSRLCQQTDDPMSPPRRASPLDCRLWGSTRRPHRGTSFRPSDSLISERV